jgi:hypothetical protein
MLRQLEVRHKKRQAAASGFMIPKAEPGKLSFIEQTYS